MNDYFYGWYFRCQGKDESIAVIPAVHLSEKKRSCSIQVITQNRSLYREFPIDQFRINRKKGVMKIGENLFSPRGMRLRFETSDADGNGEKVLVKAVLRFGEFKKPRYDIMGPFSLISGMECRHMVYSMKHTVDGVVTFGEQSICFKKAMGYMEGDSGFSFPDRYIWTQHFLPEGSVMLAAASIPLAGMHFTGVIGFYLCGEKEYRFATYLGASVPKMKNGELLIRQGPYRLRVRFADIRPGGCALKAPENGAMTRCVIENTACRADYTLMCRKRVLLHTTTDRAAAEYDTKEEYHEDNTYYRRKDKRKIFKRRHRRIQQAAESLL